MSRAIPRPQGAGRIREEGEISGPQFTWMITTVVTSFTGALVPGLLIRIAGADAWLSVALAWVLDVAVAVLLAYLGLRFPGETLVEYAATSLGPWLGRPVGLMFPLFFFFVDALMVRTVADMISGMFLPGTPGPVVGGGILAVAAYGARSGLEVVARAAEVLGPLFVVGGGLLLVLVAPKLDLTNLRPVLEHGLGPPLAGVPLPLSSLLVCLIMAMFMPYHHEPHRSLFAKVRGVTIGAIMVAGVVVAAVALMGPGPAGDYIHPDLALARNITIADFVERLDTLWMGIAVSASVLGVAIMLWAVALGLAQTFGLREYKPLVAPLAGLLLPVSLLLFEGQVDQAAFMRHIWPFYALFVEGGLVTLIWLVALVRGKRGWGQSRGRVQEPERVR